MAPIDFHVIDEKPLLTVEAFDTLWAQRAERPVYDPEVERHGVLNQCQIFKGSYHGTPESASLEMKRAVRFMAMHGRAPVKNVHACVVERWMGGANWLLSQVPRATVGDLILARLNEKVWFDGSTKSWHFYWEGCIHLERKLEADTPLWLAGPEMGRFFQPNSFAGDAQLDEPAYEARLARAARITSTPHTPEPDISFRLTHATPAKLDASDLKRIDRYTSYHAPDGTKGARHEAVRSAASALMKVILENTEPYALETAKALGAAREAMMWANASIACNKEIST